MTIQHEEDEARFSTSGDSASIQGTRLPLPSHSEIKQLLVPSKDMRKTILIRSKIREYFDRTYYESEHLDVHFVGKKCYVKVAQPIPEFSKLGRLQYHLEEENLEFQLMPSRKAEVMEG